MCLPTGLGIVADGFPNTSLLTHDTIRRSPSITGHYHYVTSAHARSKTFSEDLINTQYVSEPAMEAQDFVYALGF